MKRKLANCLKPLLPEYRNNVSKNQGNAKGVFQFYEGASQDYIPLKNIQDGMIITRDNRYLGVIEILPIQFYQKSNSKKASIMSSFREIFQNKHIRWKLKIMHDEGDSSELIMNIKKRCPNQAEPVIQKSLNNYISYLRQLGSNGAVSKRFFFIFEYSGHNGVKSRDLDEIALAIEQDKAAIISSLEGCGNICLINENEDAFLSEFLYMYFNRRTYKHETIYDRFDRLSKDFEKFNDATGLNKQLKYVDLIAPKGLKFLNRSYIIMDGLFYGYIGFSSESFPTCDLPPGWLDRFDYGSNVDIDITGKMLPHDITLALLKQLRSVRSGNAKALFNKGNRIKGQKYQTRAQNVAEVIAHMEANADLNDISIVLTIRAKTPKELQRMMGYIERDLKNKLHIEPDDCFLCCEDYFRLTMPFLYVSPAFTRIKHNVLSSKMGCFYPFTSSTINDPNGVVLGMTNDGSVLSPDIFNTDYYENANMIILGTSGAGKTFTEQLIGERSYFNGRRCFFIIPAKGYEYKKGCSLTNGLYVQLMPGSKQCINILEIRPEIEIDISKIRDGTTVEDISLLAQKVNEMITWVQLLMGLREIPSVLYSGLSNILYALYRDFGITDDNNSIYTDKTHRFIKTMPILSDFYERIPDDELYADLKRDMYPFIDGICKNMNGQTNIDLSNPYIVFDCDEKIVGKKWLPSFLYIAFILAISQVKTSENTQDLIFLDEVWKMMRNAGCAQQVQDVIKLIRGYGGGAIIATQEIHDFFNSMKEYGISVLNNAASALLLKMKPADLQLVKDNYNLSADECDNIINFKRKAMYSQGMFISNGDKINVRIMPSKLEKKTLSDKTSKIA